VRVKKASPKKKTTKFRQSDSFHVQTYIIQNEKKRKKERKSKNRDYQVIQMREEKKPKIKMSEKELWERKSGKRK